MTSAPPIGFEYRGSRLLMLALVAVAVLAVMAIFNSALPNLLRIALAVLVAASAGGSLVRLFRPRVCSVLWRADGSAHLGLRDTVLKPAGEVGAELHAAHVLGPLITLKLRWPDHARATLWLLPDNLDPDTRRRLRIRLQSMTSSAR